MPIAGVVIRQYQKYLHEYTIQSQYNKSIITLLSATDSNNVSAANSSFCCVMFCSNSVIGCILCANSSNYHSFPLSVNVTYWSYCRSNKFIDS